MECPNCQASNRSGALVCIQCGEPLYPAQQTATPRKPLTASLHPSQQPRVPEWMWEQHAELLMDLSHHLSEKLPWPQVIRRLGASFIDHCLVGLSFALTLALAWYLTGYHPDPHALQSWLKPGIILGLIHVIYTTLFQMFLASTPGYWLFSLAVVYHPETYPTLPMRIILFRWGLMIITTVALGINLGWCLIDRDRLFLHDRLAGTRVIPLHVYNRILDVTLKE